MKSSSIILSAIIIAVVGYLGYKYVYLPKVANTSTTETTSTNTSPTVTTTNAVSPPVSTSKTISTTSSTGNLIFGNTYIPPSKSTTSTFQTVQKQQTAIRLYNNLNLYNPSKVSAFHPPIVKTTSNNTFTKPIITTTHPFISPPVSFSKTISPNVKDYLHTSIKRTFPKFITMR